MKSSRARSARGGCFTETKGSTSRTEPSPWMIVSNTISGHETGLKRSRTMTLALSPPIWILAVQKCMSLLLYVGEAAEWFQPPRRDISRDVDDGRRVELLADHLAGRGDRAVDQELVERPGGRVAVHPLVLHAHQADLLGVDPVGALRQAEIVERRVVVDLDAVEVHVSHRAVLVLGEAGHRVVAVRPDLQFHRT